MFFSSLTTHFSFLFWSPTINNFSFTVEMNIEVDVNEENGRTRMLPSFNEAFNRNVFANITNKRAGSPIEPPSPKRLAGILIEMSSMATYPAITQQLAPIVEQPLSQVEQQQQYDIADSNLEQSELLGPQQHIEHQQPELVDSIHSDEQTTHVDTRHEQQQQQQLPLLPSTSRQAAERDANPATSQQEPWWTGTAAAKTTCRRRAQSASSV